MAGSVRREKPSTAAVRLTPKEKAQLNTLARLEGSSEDAVIRRRLFPYVTERLRIELTGEPMASEPAEV